MKIGQSHGAGEAERRQGQVSLLHRGRDSAIQRQLQRASESNGNARLSKPRVSSLQKPTQFQAAPAAAQRSGTVHAVNTGISALPQSTVGPLESNDAPSRTQADILSDTRTFESVQELIAARKQLLIALYGQRPYSDSLRTEYQMTLHDQDKYWQLLASRRQVYKADRELFMRLGASIRFHIDQTQRHGSFRDHLLKCADSDAEQQLFLVKELGLRLDAARLLSAHEIPTAVTAAAKALHAHLPAAATAEQLAAQGAELVPTLTQGNRERPIPSLNARKEALLAAMEQLCAETLDPRVRAKRVQALRQQWKDISLSDQHYLSNLDQRFAVAGDKAYEPSRAYFSALAKKLADNLAKRTSLAESLRDFYAESDWKAMDWKSVESMLGVVRLQWQAHAPTEREQTKPVKELFERSYKNIESMLHQQYDHNADKGRKLIALMESLSRQAASSASLEAMLGIRNQWKVIGVMRSEEKAELKQQLADVTRIAVANRKQQLHNLQRQRTAVKRARSLIEDVEKATELDGEALLDQREAVSEIGKQFEALLPDLHLSDTDLPKANVELMFKERYARYFSTAERMLAERRQRAMQDFHQASRLIGSAEVEFVSRGNKDEVRSASEEASHYIQNVRFLPRHGQALLMNRLNFIQRIKE